jgi:hypothetical protein
MRKINNQKYSTKQFKGFKTKMRCGFNYDGGYHYTDVYTTETNRAEIRSVFSSKHFYDTWGVDLHITQFLSVEQLQYGAEIIGQVIDTCEKVESMWSDD